MKIINFTHEHIAQARLLALATYEEEREAVAALPFIKFVPDLTEFADNGLGVAAFDNNKMTGFLCCYSPFDNAFDSTKAKGIFSPMGASAALKENRTKIYAAMYQVAAAKWVKAGAVSHAICLYAHDEELQRQFYNYGFGLRCMDTVRAMEQIDCTPCMDYDFVELTQKEYSSVYSLNHALDRHFCESPFFMNRKPCSQEEFDAACNTEEDRYFAAKYHGDLIAYLQISNTGETFVADGSDYRHISGAYCLSECRGKGVYQDLLNFTISTLKAEGHTRLGVDFESFNPTAYGFWLKYFTAYTHGVVRRIDECCLELV